MRPLGFVSPVVVAAALAFSTASCGADSISAAKVTSLTVTPPTPPPTTPAPTVTPYAEVNCGTGATIGLSVVVVSEFGGAACAVAIAVTDAYVEAGDWSESPRVISVDDGSWTCRERMGSVNPYQECTSRQDPREKVRLYS